jgi:hypothetical protein
MRNIKILLAFIAFGFFIACGGGNQKTETTSETPATPATTPPDASSYDPIEEKENLMKKMLN